MRADFAGWRGFPGKCHCANRALDANPAADLSPLAAAARQAGLGEPEITRTLDSARKTCQPHPDRQAEEVN